ncbi:hypothetical protein JB92DRAFT_3053299 [Gautieria morchelliformis]|nr:hypothetical protein JB92DRAFT_3053299 [Gautieria morchelliformis]
MCTVCIVSLWLIVPCVLVSSQHAGSMEQTQGEATRAEPQESQASVIQLYDPRQASTVDALSREQHHNEICLNWIPPDTSDPTSDPLYEREFQGVQLARRCCHSPETISWRELGESNDHGTAEIRRKRCPL